jgi:hypothetical protein
VSLAPPFSKLTHRFVMYFILIKIHNKISSKSQTYHTDRVLVVQYRNVLIRD